MKVLVLGGTGSIGAAVVQVLLERQHEVWALGRSQQACEKLSKAGATPVPGDISDPAKWIKTCDAVDAVVHAAAIWGDEMAGVDRQLVDALLAHLPSAESAKALIYTGGCWMYGETGDSVATEESPFKPLPSFDWCLPLMQKVLTAPEVRGMVIHPAMVYERDGGVFEHIVDDASNLGYTRVIGHENVRWPLVHRIDLAHLYVLMLEQGNKGDVYNAATNPGVPIGAITRAIASRLGISSDPVLFDTATAMVELGSWAEGYAIDQQMSGDKARSHLSWQPHYDDVFAEIL